MPFLTSNWVATSSPPVVVGRPGKIDSLFVIGYNSHIVPADRPPLPGIESSVADSVLGVVSAKV